MAQVNEFVHKNIKAHLEKCGLDSSSASTAAMKGVDFFSGQVCNSKNAFKDACDHAGAWAQSMGFKFKYVSPRRAGGQRKKKPQEVFNF
ncbi:MAG: hypothetical protein ACRDD9_23470 [Shewanella sp.]